MSTKTIAEANKERNAKVLKRILYKNEEYTGIVESMKHRFKVDITNPDAFPVMKEGFSWRALEKKLSMREYDSASAFSQFLRAGLQTITNAAYESVGTTYDSWVTSVPSNKDTELYAPNHGVAFPRQIGEGMLFPEVGVAALDIKLKNYDFGAMYTVSQNLLDDDQSGSFQRQAALLGEYMRLVAEVLCYGKLASVSGMQYADYKIPVSETQPSSESVYPWSTSLVGGGATRPGSFAVLTQTSLQSAAIALMNQKNLQGLKLLVEPNMIVHGPAYTFDSAVLLNSSWYPTGATAGALGGTFSINPLHNLYERTVSRFVFKNDGTVNGDSKAWYLMDAKKPWFVLQQREGVSVVAEANNSGANFERRVMRFRAFARMNADHLDPRFAFQGDDGSVV